MGNYAVDAALAVALANTLFFAAATAESTGKVLLYLLITVAPFAVIAPLIGPALDKLQHGRRIALGASSFARAVLAVVMALNFDSWVLYPCALGMLVLSKSFSVLKAAITPRVLPPDITLVKTNSRLTVFGLMAGGVAGALAAGLSWAFGSTGALILTGLLSVVGGLLCLRIPSWVESTAGEIPVDGVGPKAKRAFPLSVTTTLWANGTIRVETGFLALFIAFVIKREYTEASAFTQLLLLGVVGVAAGIGGFIGNGLGAKLPLTKPETVSILGAGRDRNDHPDRRAHPQPGHRGAGRPGRLDRVVAGEGVPRFGDPARTAGSQPGFGLRPERDRAAALLGVRRSHRPADRRSLDVRSGQRLLDRFRGDHRAAGDRPDPELAGPIRPLPVPVARLLQVDQAFPALGKGRGRTDVRGAAGTGRGPARHRSWISRRTPHRRPAADDADALATRRLRAGMAERATHRRMVLPAGRIRPADRSTAPAGTTARLPTTGLPGSQDRPPGYQTPDSNPAAEPSQPPQQQRTHRPGMPAADGDGPRESDATSGDLLTASHLDSPGGAGGWWRRWSPVSLLA